MLKQKKIALTMFCLSLAYACSAIAEDASSLLSNPAGLTDIHQQQLIFSIYGINTKNFFKGTSTSTFPSLPTESGTSLSSEKLFLPSVFYAKSLNDSVTLGLAVASPPDLSLSTRYEDDSLLRYIYTQLTYNLTDITPAIGFKINDQLSAGVGLDMYHLDTTYDAMISFGAPPDQSSHNTADSWQYGWHAGLFYHFWQATRVGLSYRSSANFHTRGRSTFTSFPSGNQSISDDYHFDVTLPAKTTLSLMQGLSPRFAVKGSLDYTEWSCIRAIELKNVDIASSSIDSTKVFNWHNVFTFNMAADYMLTQRLAIEGSAGIAQNYALQGKYLPMVGVGAHYQASKMIGFNAGYTHFFGQNYPAISVSSSASLNGINKPYLDIAAVQMVLNF